MRNRLDDWSSRWLNSLWSWWILNTIPYFCVFIYLFWTLHEENFTWINRYATNWKKFEQVFEFNKQRRRSDLAQRSIFGWNLIIWARKAKARSIINSEKEFKELDWRPVKTYEPTISPQRNVCLLLWRHELFHMVSIWACARSSSENFWIRIARLGILLRNNASDVYEHELAHSVPTKVGWCKSLLDRRCSLGMCELSFKWPILTAQFSKLLAAHCFRKCAKWYCSCLACCTFTAWDDETSKPCFSRPRRLSGKLLFWNIQLLPRHWLDEWPSL